jgi:GTP-binding protein HflX
MKKVFGHTAGLKANQMRRLEKFYRRRIPVDQLVTKELARDICRLSYEMHRQIGLLIDRSGRIKFVIVGDHQGIHIPPIPDYRAAPGRLMGLRCVHTHLTDESLTADDLTDLSLLRLDMIAAVTINRQGLPNQIHIGHILPLNKDKKTYQLLGPIPSDRLDIGCLGLIHALEDELDNVRLFYDAGKGSERAFLISVTSTATRNVRESLAELSDLAVSCGIEVVEVILQQRKKKDPRFLIGLGKLRELTIRALQKAATLFIFDQELNPSQIRSITDRIEIKVIDRTQLILDIFSQRAQTREGKLQVELAQLRYLLPRLITKNTAMSRLTGGIGGRGPGETKLEINRRRARDRIFKLENALSQVQRQRKQQRSQRNKKGLPIISIVGYTNAGKSTLLNTLTQSKVHVENRLFATLDPASRRLRFPRDIEVIITDTVGFIKNLPKDLLVAFRATLEELENADLLVHVVDISNPFFMNHIASVEKILADLKLDHVPVILALNKKDLVEDRRITKHARLLDGFPISAKDKGTLAPLLQKMAAVTHHRNLSENIIPPDRNNDLWNR